MFGTLTTKKKLNCLVAPKTEDFKALHYLADGGMMDSGMGEEDKKSDDGKKNYGE